MKMFKFKYANAVCAVISGILLAFDLYQGHPILALGQAGAVVINLVAYWMLNEQDKEMAELKQLEKELEEANDAIRTRMAKRTNSGKSA